MRGVRGWGDEGDGGVRGEGGEGVGSGRDTAQGRGRDLLCEVKAGKEASSRQNEEGRQRVSGQEAAESELFLLLFPCPHFKEIFWELYSTTLAYII